MENSTITISSKEYEQLVRAKVTLAILAASSEIVESYHYNDFVKATVGQYIDYCNGENKPETNKEAENNE